MNKFSLFFSGFLTRSQQKALLFLLVFLALGKCLELVSYQGNVSPKERLAMEEALQTDVKAVIDVRTASIQELEMVPGIGEKTATKIVELRSEFGCLEDLQMVRGIGPVKFAKLKEYFVPFGVKHQKILKQEKKAEMEYDKQAQLIDINTASVDELSSVKGIGQVTAGKIAEYRACNGKFEKVEDLLKIKGIGPKKLEVISPQVFVK